MADAYIKSEDLVISGNLTVQGSTDLTNLVTTSSTDLETVDRLLTINKGQALASNSAGIEIDNAGSIAATLGYSTAGGWSFEDKKITTQGIIYASGFAHHGGGTATYTGQITDLSNHNTGSLAEGSNLYFTDARAQASALTAMSTASIDDIGDVNLPTDLSTITNNAALTWDAGNQEWVPYYITGHVSTTTLTEGSNLYYTQGRFDTAFGNKNTDNLNEGTTNLYYTDARADARIGLASINDLSDVTTSSPNQGEVLSWTGSNWSHGVTSVVPTLNVFHAPSSAPFSTANQTHTATGDTAITKDFDVKYSNSKISIDVHIPLTLTGGGPTDFLQLTLYRVISGVETQLAVWGAKNDSEYVANISTYDEPATSGTVTYKVKIDNIGGTLTINPTAWYSNPRVKMKIEELATDVASKLILQSDSSKAYWDAGSKTIQNLSAPVNPNDAVNKSSMESYVTTTLSAKDELNELNDVSVSGAVSGQVLKYDGVQWTAQTDTTLADTNALPEGSSNLYFQTDRARAAISVAGDLTYDPSTGIISTQGLASSTTDDLSEGSTNKYFTEARVLATFDSPQTIGQGGDTLTIGGDLAVTGDFTVTGEVTQVDIVNLSVEDNMIELNNFDDQTQQNNNDAGLYIKRGATGTNAVFMWDESEDRFKMGFSSDAPGSTINITSKAILDVKSTEAMYADLAEKYESDFYYDTGTVLIFGGDKEVTRCTHLADPRVAGVVSENPAYCMNAELGKNREVTAVTVALRGKIPCKVAGKVSKGDILVTMAGAGETAGCATALHKDSAPVAGWCVVGKSLEDKDDDGIRLINIVV